MQTNLDELTWSTVEVLIWSKKLHHKEANRMTSIKAEKSNQEVHPFSVLGIETSSLFPTGGGSETVKKLGMKPSSVLNSSLWTT